MAAARELELVGAGREAEVFAWGDGRVLRLAREPAAVAVIEREAIALASAHSAGAPVPAVYERLTVDGRPGVVLERLDGADLLERVRRRPWTAATVGRTLGRRHAELHAVAAPLQLPELREELRHRLGSPLVPADVRETALRRLRMLPDGDRLLHGDFHPANLLRTPLGDVVIDWTNGARGDPAADVARTLILLGGALPEDAPVLLRTLLPALRRLVRVTYLRAYGPLDRPLVERWRRVWAAARLSEDIEADRALLLAQAR